MRQQNINRKPNYLPKLKANKILQSFAITSAFICILLLPSGVLGQEECPYQVRVFEEKTGDFDGDGLVDRFIQRDGKICVQKIGVRSKDGRLYSPYLSWAKITKWGNNDYTFVGDFNGDGKDDFASAHNDTIYIYFSRGDSFAPPQTWKVSGNWGSHNYTWAEDFNGDGKDDIASANGGKVFMYLSSGKSFTSQVWTVPNKWSGPEFVMHYDHNGDGKADILSFNRHEVYMNFSKGNGFVSQTWAIKPCDPSLSVVDEWRLDFSDNDGIDSNFTTFSKVNGKLIIYTKTRYYDNDGSIIAYRVSEQDGSFCVKRWGDQ